MADLKKPVDPQQEIEMQVNELEERVDRLRAMYEQYFMGYEKLEPAIPRKDVDRRFANLRKINIRNTALRFRFNVVTQKFNTYAMYWTRICRQIEEGTFKRHVVKANKRFGVRAKKDELSIDVELGDFEVDMDDFDSDAETADALADAEAHASEPRSMPKSSPRLEMPTERPAQPAAGFGALEDDFGGASDTVPPSVTPQHQRAMRGAVLPAGLKQRVLVKKGPNSVPGGDAAPSSTPSPPQVRPRMPSVSDHTPAPMATPRVRAPMPSVPEHTPAPMASPVGAMRGRMPSVPEQAPPSARPRMPSVGDHAPPSARGQLPSSPDHAPSTSVIRAAAPHVHRSPPGVNRPAISPTAQSVRVAVAKPAAGAPNPAPSVQRIATAAPNPPNAAPSVQRVPVAARAPSATAPNPSLGRPPSTAPGAGPASTPRVPVAPRVPVGLPSSVARTPAAPAVAPKEPAPSERKMPAPPLVRPGGMPAAAVRPPAPSAPAESERNPVPSRRPPPPLPSQIKKT